jgi:cysteinyl-tRNA synthetase
LWQDEKQMTLNVYNTLSGKKEPFTPIDPAHVRVYLCGPTVYDMAHIGHARSAVAFDIVVRSLRQRYAKVTFVRNYTDIDDKIIKRANDLGQTPEQVSSRYADEYLKDMDALGCIHPDVSPRVSTHMPQIITMVGELIDKNVAYPAAGDVYYAVESFPSYGKLAKRNLEDMQAGARVEPGEHKRNPMDFALWKGAKPGEPSWPTQWGAGRPGWHIECSAMAREHLGVTIDIHAGGKDLMFPHHENEIAQSEAANGAQFVRYWLHNGFVNIDDEKMSKSLGNFFTVREVLRVVDAQAIRWFLVSTHYRSPINFSDHALREAEQRVVYIYETLKRMKSALGSDRAGAPSAVAVPSTVAADGGASGAAVPSAVTAGGGASDAAVSSAVPAGTPLRDEAAGRIVPRFEEAMDDDFNTARALGDVSEVFRLANEILDKPGDAATDQRTLRTIYDGLSAIADVLGIFDEDPDVVLRRIAARKQSERGVDAAAIQALIDERNAARAAKNFKRADEIRDELAGQGIAIKDSATGTTWNVQ